MKEDKEETARWEAGKRFPVDTSDLKIVEATKDRPKPAPDTSSYKMETIRDPGSAGPMVAFAALVVVLLILVLVWS